MSTSHSSAGATANCCLSAARASLAFSGTPSTTYETSALVSPGRTTERLGRYSLVWCSHPAQPGLVWSPSSAWSGLVSQLSLVCSGLPAQPGLVWPPSSAWSGLPAQSGLVWSLGSARSGLVSQLSLVWSGPAQPGHERHLVPTDGSRVSTLQSITFRRPSAINVLENNIY